MTIDKYNIDDLENILIFGAGNAAKQLVSELNINTAIFASSTGGEKILSKKSIKYTDLPTDKLFNIIIASQFVVDIYRLIKKSSISYQNIYYFNLYRKSICLADDLFRIKKKELTLYAFYDLEQNPVSFDACVFANAAELYRVENNFEAIHFVIVPPILKYGRLCDSHFYSNGSLTAYKDRIDMLLVPVFSLIPSKIGCSVLAHREEVECLLTKNQNFPYSYNVNKPKDTHKPMDFFKLSRPIGFFQAPERAKQFIKDYLDNNKAKKIIIFTIREYLNQPNRNNNLDVLNKFIGSLCKKTYHPIIIRDTVNSGRGAIDKLAEFCNFSVASVDVGIRMALYESAYLNIFCNNGPVMLAAFNKKTNYIVFKLIDEDISCTTSKFFKARFGIDETNKYYRWANSNYQRLVWKDDSFETMTLEFNKFVKDFVDAWTKVMNLDRFDVA